MHWHLDFQENSLPKSAYSRNFHSRSLFFIGLFGNRHTVHIFA
uniref:Uncharacterized protein n=1 Tax=Anguilla anguilla TaxID=7936 RepID=A0A0E9W4H7_ANGAN